MQKIISTTQEQVSIAANGIDQEILRYVTTGLLKDQKYFGSIEQTVGKAEGK
ncbi:MAG: hypothetical protein HRT90_05740 [Candidatus Margulisbacteria bacterium]|nr:hypothetical protein [Candidatus Margulisiibacteriota bacterium]